MLDIRDREERPIWEEIGCYINNPVFTYFCTELKEKYCCTEKIEFSSCSWEFGWNVKFKKSGRSICTIYPREGFFTVLVVIGQKEKQFVENILPECTPELREIYQQTKAGNGQKWLMIDVEDQDKLCDDVLRLIDIRRG